MATFNLGNGTISITSSGFGGSRGFHTSELPLGSVAEKQEQQTPLPERRRWNPTPFNHPAWETKSNIGRYRDDFNLRFMHANIQVMSKSEVKPQGRNRPLPVELDSKHSSVHLEAPDKQAQSLVSPTTNSSATGWFFENPEALPIKGGGLARNWHN
ncbi:hypothetical protein Bbelb_208800 [Branchiostoma belcheri]|nr:hypothetical protein Bbelb_208800 [Branchiostoma belcheri]